MGMYGDECQGCRANDAARTFSSTKLQTVRKYQSPGLEPQQPNTIVQQDLDMLPSDYLGSRLIMLHAQHMW